MSGSQRPLSVSALTLLLCACAEPAPPPVETYEPDQIIAEAIAFATEFERLDAGPIASLHGMMDGFGEIWANEKAAAVFRSIDGSDPTATAEFPRGSILVKNNLDADGEPKGMLTILAKFEAGYSDETKDWFFAAVDPQGQVINDLVGSGTEVYFCYDCHSQMGANTDLVIGLPPHELR
jgi:hypothetical protein